MALDPTGFGDARADCLTPTSEPTTAGLNSRGSVPTSPDHPVWCEAPSPSPLSPWKYSWNRQVGPMRVGLDELLAAVDRTTTGGVPHEERDDPVGEVGGDLGRWR